MRVWSNSAPLKNGRVAIVADILKQGAAFNVLDCDDRGKVELSMKVVDQLTGEDLSKDKDATEGRCPSGADFWMG